MASPSIDDSDVTSLSSDQNPPHPKHLGHHHFILRVKVLDSQLLEIKQILKNNLVTVASCGSTELRSVQHQREESNSLPGLCTLANMDMVCKHHQAS